MTRLQFSVLMILHAEQKPMHFRSERLRRCAERLEGRGLLRSASDLFRFTVYSITDMGRDMLRAQFKEELFS